MISERITRKLDSLGRITIPKGLRARLEWEENDEIEIYTAKKDNKMFVCLRKVDNADARREQLIALMKEFGLEIPEDL